MEQTTKKILVRCSAEEHEMLRLVSLQTNQSRNDILRELMQTLKQRLNG